MLVILTEQYRFGAGVADVRPQEIAIDPETIHRLAPRTSDGGVQTTRAFLADSTELTLLGSVRELVEVINEPYRMLSE